MTSYNNICIGAYVCVKYTETQAPHVPVCAMSVSCVLTSSAPPPTPAGVGLASSVRALHVLTPRGTLQATLSHHSVVDTQKKLDVRPLGSNHTACHWSERGACTLSFTARGALATTCWRLGAAAAPRRAAAVAAPPSPPCPASPYPRTLPLVLPVLLLP